MLSAVICSYSARAGQVPAHVFANELSYLLSQNTVTIVSQLQYSVKSLFEKEVRRQSMYTFLFKDNFDFDVLRHRQTILFSFVSRKGHDSLLSKYIVNICSVVLFQSLLEAWSLWRTEFYKLMDIIYAIFNNISSQVESFMTVSAVNYLLK